MIPLIASLALLLGVDGGIAPPGGALPVCGNGLIRTVVKRVGCTVGDSRCWLRSGGFCTDYVRSRLGLGRGGGELRFDAVVAEAVRPGDVATFVSRAHYAWVDAVRRDGQGRPIAVDLSEYNFGGCWVDRDMMVTDRYGVLSRRAGVALNEVDGGFLRPRPDRR